MEELYSCKYFGIEWKYGSRWLQYLITNRSQWAEVRVLAFLKKIKPHQSQKLDVLIQRECSLTATYNVLEICAINLSSFFK